ncbi:MAG: UPF0182 family protein [Cyanomargarita calcarea GSE-NOS-MK-12-04C]|jgi:hypothetical protein|uniref:UPF0182 protein KME60_08400 n=1 Tax=Cyanomargarita calcarea GSE-NOS-MK-12-04C TaxID=2839659 RepID=A0A951USN0_9CYAN|nr:UPF0182 family protein [Cyanomargarita calcarea GSE-NOS-MK-12-04C]
MFWKRSIKILLFIFALVLLVELLSRLVVEILWYQEVGYLRAFLLRLITQAILWVVVSGATAWYLLKNLSIAQKQKHPHPTLNNTQNKNEKNSIYASYRLVSPTSYRYTKTAKSLRLRWLLPIVVGLSLLLSLFLVHYGQIAISQWHLDVRRVSITPRIPARFQPEEIWQLGLQIVSQIWYIGIVIGVAIAVLVYPQLLLNTFAILLSVVLGMIFSAHGLRVLQYFYRTLFNSTEPLFDKDISFYIFSIPIWELLQLWVIGLFLYNFIAVSLTYLLSGDSISQGFFAGFSSKQQRHLCTSGGFLMLVVAFSYWLSRYELLYSPRGVTYGASYTDVAVQLPAYNVLSTLALAIAVYLLLGSIFWRPKSSFSKLLFHGLGVFVVLAVAGVAVPSAVQYLLVQPNELAREQPYIQRTIALTRQAFNLDAIDARTFEPQGQLTKADIAANDLTIRNIRLWDQQPLLKTNRELQQIRLYYQFPDADIDRYTLQTDVTTRRPAAPQKPPAPDLGNNINTTERRQVLIAARELNYNAVPQEAQTWINRHLIYTHGYGFTLSPVNVVGAGGLPEYFVKDIGGEGAALSTSSESIRASIPIGQPRIYFGETINTYVMTGTQVKEFDYPSGSNNVYNVYDGQGGISIGSLWKKLLFAMYFKDWRVLLTREFLPQTEVLFRRNINERIRAIAPFLRYDSNPYLVVADTNPDNTKQEFAPNRNYLYWIVDAYTTSEHYPYSDTSVDDINYIRNSVKVVVDAYNGSVDFYVADTSDPIIASWRKIFPNMFKPLSTMPINLRTHIRYPVDYFQIQSERLMTYHMTDTQVFYNREDQWQIPNEIYGNEPRPVEPYFLITSLPTVPFEEFILLLPYTPRGRSNLIAWLAARADGENYGRLLLYQFPKERLVYGPEQIEARINQDPIISQQISLWNRQGSKVIQGNLLIIPIEQSLLYVEPIYLEATQNSLPTLIRVVVAYENRIVMAQTLQQALQAIFQPETTPAPAIIRPLEEPAPLGQQ